MDLDHAGHRAGGADQARAILAVIFMKAPVAFWPWTGAHPGVLDVDALGRDAAQEPAAMAAAMARRQLLRDARQARR